MFPKRWSENILGALGAHGTVVLDFTLEKYDVKVL
jgi:hypothetical protein